MMLENDSQSDGEINTEAVNHWLNQGPDSGVEERPLLEEEGDEVTLENEGDKQKTFTVEDAVENMGYGWFQIKIFLICGLFTATDALEMLLLAVLSPILRCEWLLSDAQLPWITTVVFIGMFLGSYLWGFASDRYGRLKVMTIASIWILYFGILTTFSPNYWWILFLRAVVGFGFGGALQSFTLHTEFLPSKIRAKVLIIANVCWAAGSTFEILMAYWVIPTLGWRALVAFSALPMFITIFFIWRLPESARYLLAAGETEKATKVLEEGSKLNKKTLPPGKLVSSQTVARGKVGDLFHNSELVRTSIILWLNWFGAACSYYGVILTQSTILERHSTCGAAPAHPDEEPLHESCHCNLLQKSDYVSMIYATFGEFVNIPINLLMIDYIGRRWTLICNYLVAGVFFLLIQICTTRIWLTIFIFGVRSFTSGIFNTVYIYTTEVYPTTVRSVGLGSCSAMARVGAIVTPFLAQVILPYSLPLTVWLYGGLCLTCAIGAFFLPIETLGREMKQTAH